jgi:16S rRNA (adenine1518-N6/adenine1519-N6)-dimethyltransferase
MIRPKKSLGQNFLIDQNIIENILKICKLEKKHIVEIGPGTGNLTSKILQSNFLSLTLIEKDSRMVSHLRDKFEYDKRINFFHDDILDFKLEDNMKENTIIFGNLPYNISTQILVKLIKFNVWPPFYSDLVLMFQKEVAEKILAKYKTSKYGRIGIISNSRLQIVNYFNISKSSFFPKPKIDSTVIHFKPLYKNTHNIKNLENLEHVTRVLFSNKRKMINKAFRRLFNDSDKAAMKLKIDLSLRPSDLSCEEYFKITELYEEISNFKS